MRKYLEIIGNGSMLQPRFAGRTNWTGATFKPSTSIANMLESGTYDDKFLNMLRVDLLKVRGEGQDYWLVSDILRYCRPTHIVFETDSFFGDQAVALDTKLLTCGYTYRGRSGNSVQYSQRSVLLVVDEKWSTGSIARDLQYLAAHQFPSKDLYAVDYIGWHQYPSDLAQIISEYDTAIGFTLVTPNAWPELKKHGVVCCGPVDIDLMQNSGKPFENKVVGAVSNEVYQLLTKLPYKLRVCQATATARMSRFIRRGDQPLDNFFVLGWCGVPNSSGSFGGQDLKRYGMFQQICTGTPGAEAKVSHQEYTYDSMHEFYGDLNVLVCTSLTEGGPLPVFEAIACGVPVISTNVGVVKECMTIPTFETVDEAVYLLTKLLDRDARQKLADEQYSELLHNMSMEKLYQDHWKPFFEASMVVSSNSPCLL